MNQNVKTNALGRRRPHSQDKLIAETRPGHASQRAFARGARTTRRR